MRFVFRFRSVTALLILICVAANFIWMPLGVSWAQISHFPEEWVKPVTFGQAHLALFVIVQVVMLFSALILLLMPTYSKAFSNWCLACTCLCLVCALSFHFVLPAMWVLPLWASWRLCGSPTPFTQKK